jgi:hypothetical protein
MQSNQEFPDVLLTFLAQLLPHWVRTDHQPSVRDRAFFVGEGHFARHTPVACRQGQTLKIPVVGLQNQLAMDLLQLGQTRQVT